MDWVETGGSHSAWSATELEGNSTSVIGCSAAKVMMLRGLGTVNTF